MASLNAVEDLYAVFFLAVVLVGIQIRILHTISTHMAVVMHGSAIGDSFRTPWLSCAACPHFEWFIFGICLNRCSDIDV